MNKELMRAAGFTQQVNDFENNICPFCNKLIPTLGEFRDELSKKEYGISGLCQSCQDKTFGEE